MAGRGHSIQLGLNTEPHLEQRDDRRRVLVVDDEAVIRDLISRALKDFLVLHADNGQQALAIIEQEEVEVILTDVMMPGMSGLDLLREIKTRDPNRVVVMMTGYADKELVIKALKADADDFISKPINLLQLKTTIDKALEKKDLRQEVAQLKRLDRMKADFLGLISHKLKTPITSISLFIQNLSRGFSDPSDPTYNETLDLILEESNHLGYLIKDLLFYSDVILEETPPEPTRSDLRSLIDNVVLELSYAAANKELELDCTLPEQGLPELMLDQKRIAFALRALLENAIKFTSNGGRIGVRAEADEHSVRMIVTDNGPGIPEKELPKVFEKFYQIDPDNTGQVRGFGLGLFYARQFVKGHGGTISLSSSQSGTAATIELPR